MKQFGIELIGPLLFNPCLPIYTQTSFGQGSLHVCMVHCLEKEREYLYVPGGIIIYASKHVQQQRQQQHAPPT